MTMGIIGATTYETDDDFDDESEDKKATPAILMFNFAQSFVIGFLSLSYIKVESLPRCSTWTGCFQVCFLVTLGLPILLFIAIVKYVGSFCALLLRLMLPFSFRVHERMEISDSYVREMCKFRVYILTFMSEFIFLFIISITKGNEMEGNHYVGFGQMVLGLVYSAYLQADSLMKLKFVSQMSLNQLQKEVEMSYVVSA